MLITKASGVKEEFNHKKILKTLMKAGANHNQSKQILNKLKTRLYPGISTNKILDIILKELKQQPEICAKYDLKRAIMLLGPTGFPFEEYFAKILQNYGYQTKTNQHLKGKNIIHEVDIIAQKKKKYMVECKFHNSMGKHTDVKVALYVNSRFEDLKQNFDFSWLSTNTRVSRDVLEYARGVNMKVTSWHQPNNESLSYLIEKKKLYPITVLSNLNKNTKEKLFSSGLILVKELINIDFNELQKRTRLSTKILRRIVSDCNKICGIGNNHKHQ